MFETHIQVVSAALRVAVEGEAETTFQPPQLRQLNPTQQR
jgi:hypothetical protein